MQKLGVWLWTRLLGREVLEPPSPHSTQPWGQQSVTTEMLNPPQQCWTSGLEAHLKALKLGLGNG